MKTSNYYWESTTAGSLEFLASSTTDGPLTFLESTAQGTNDYEQFQITGLEEIAKVLRFEESIPKIPKPKRLLRITKVDD